MSTGKDYYSILGVASSVDDVVLAAVYRALLKKYHPDVFSGSNVEAELRTKEIIEAYEILSNADSRRAYDKARKSGGSNSYRQKETPDSDGYVPDSLGLAKNISLKLRTCVTQLRVCPDTLGRITKFSKHEPN
jgi:DnaJ-class molecular chaperone